MTNCADPVVIVYFALNHRESRVYDMQAAAVHADLAVVLEKMERSGNLGQISKIVASKIVSIIRGRARWAGILQAKRARAEQRELLADVRVKQNIAKRKNDEEHAMKTLKREQAAHSKQRYGPSRRG